MTCSSSQPDATRTNAAEEGGWETVFNPQSRGRVKSEKEPIDGLCHSVLSVPQSVWPGGLEIAQDN